MPFPNYTFLSCPPLSSLIPPSFSTSFCVSIPPLPLFYLSIPPIIIIILPPPVRDPGDERLNPKLSGEEGGGVRAGETRPAQRPQEPRLYPSGRPHHTSLPPFAPCFRSCSSWKARVHLLHTTEFSLSVDFLEPGAFNVSYRFQVSLPGALLKMASLEGLEKEEFIVYLHKAVEISVFPHTPSRCTHT